MTRKRFAPEFIAAIVKEVDDGYSQSEVARKYGLSSKTVNRWYLNHKKTLDQKTLSANQEIAQLKRELRRYQEENEFLKKASAYFARQSK